MRRFPATPVTVAKAEVGDVPVEVRQIGSVDPVAVIAVKAQIGGELTRVLFKEGDDVRQGQRLFEIDPRPYQQAIDQAQAAIEKDNALIRQAEANLARDRVQTSNAKEQADRYAALAKEGLIWADQNLLPDTFNAQKLAAPVARDFGQSDTCVGHDQRGIVRSIGACSTTAAAAP